MQTTLQADDYQYYIVGSGDFDSSSVDDYGDGLLAPGGTGIRVRTSIQYGEVEVEIKVIDGPLELPSGPDVVASACNLFIEDEVSVDSSGGPTVFRHNFGRQLLGSVLVQKLSAPVERHTITFSTVPLEPARWRSEALALAQPELPALWPDIVDSYTDDEQASADEDNSVQHNGRGRNFSLENESAAEAFLGTEPLSERLETVGDVVIGVAMHDRLFADGLAAADPAIQRAVALWAVFQYCAVNPDRNGILLRAVQSLEDLGLLPAEFEDAVSPDGHLTSSQQRLAVDLVRAAADTDPERAAFATLSLVLASAGASSNRYLQRMVTRFGLPVSPATKHTSRDTVRASHKPQRTPNHLVDRGQTSARQPRIGMNGSRRSSARAATAWHERHHRCTASACGPVQRSPSSQPGLVDARPRVLRASVGKVTVSLVPLGPDEHHAC